MFLGASLGLAVLASAGCAHVPASASDEAQKPDRMVVTGSRIPQRVDPKTGRVASVSPVQVFTREDLMRSGQAGNLPAALSQVSASGIY
jgi:outer membrane cobalamin receptor